MDNLFKDKDFISGMKLAYINEECEVWLKKEYVKYVKFFKIAIQ